MIHWTEGRGRGAEPPSGFEGRSPERLGSSRVAPRGGGRCPRRAQAASLALLLAVFPSRAPAATPGAPPETAAQAAPPRADGAKTILDLQRFRLGSSLATDGPGKRRGTASLVDLSPEANVWFLLTLDWGSGAVARYHLENPRPNEQRLSLSAAAPHGILLSSRSGDVPCDLWSGRDAALDRAKGSTLPFVPLCDGRLYLRRTVKAHPTEIEAVTGFLRDHVWQGEKVISFVRREFFRDAFLETATSGGTLRDASAIEPLREGPQGAAVSDGDATRLVVPRDLGIELADGSRGLALGRWYPVAGLAGVYVSLIQPQATPDAPRGTLRPLDAVESRALDYLVAFDLAAFDLGFAVGTEHPRLGWSERVPGDVRDRRLPGPDGIDSASPLVTNGMLSPALLPFVTATFTGGFKREHGAFHEGKLARQNRGSHYGFVEEGVVFSKLEPGLATLYVLDDGSVDMKTWSSEDDALLPRVRYARQNGVPLVEHDPASGTSVPGPLVAQWGAGNWSGSDDKNLRTLRAGVCLQDAPSGRFLVYAYFSGATPSAMAKVFLAYGCRYAMHLDMNALEHTYLGLYRHAGSEVAVEHLIEGMAVVDRTHRGRLVPRFIGAPDDRDFFYLVRRDRSP